MLCYMSNKAEKYISIVHSTNCCICDIYYILIKLNTNSVESYYRILVAKLRIYLVKISYILLQVLSISVSHSSFKPEVKLILFLTGTQKMRFSFWRIINNLPLSSGKKTAKFTTVYSCYITTTTGLMCDLILLYLCFSTSCQTLITFTL